jgi:RNA 3'-terminal phosphate cyclase (ATP)
MLTIDGSEGEGGGQVLRTALGLSALTGTPFRLENVRGRRRKPGVLRQHLCAIEAAAAICGAEVEGATLGSATVTFRPGRVRSGDYGFEIGSAGSATLVLQAVLPALITAEGASTLSIEGGTHNPQAPPFDFLERSFAPILARTGAELGLSLVRWGFYPAGGGCVRAQVAPAPRLAGFELLERGPVAARRVTAVVANLSGNIAAREAEVVRERLGLEPADVQVRQVSSNGPGNVVLVDVATASHTEVFTAFGERGIRAEAVAERVASETRAWLDSGAPVGEHLADQLVIPLAMAGSGAYRIGAPSPHLVTNVAVVRRFLDVPLECVPVGTGLFEVRVAKGA